MDNTLKNATIIHIDKLIGENTRGTERNVLFYLFYVYPHSLNKGKRSV